ncbi:DNA alkylation repair protein [Candidatus Megaera venefica]|jgi:3-methyladenine DNA glycosylase AlkC|uniref:DNA alkylation repair protein n=1 Tax=Candidatus Megaera venefica TaxID=2055910 RepID=A0ABU5NDY5_9RICK|nr:HEAT repeat domain-containing protein [Candidatus Megaera venefica]MBY0534069.1 DNA alkylation repair protein [Rickettsiaceae bacterium]MEA0971365.1 DNA alkylation repair protein [Candidatus Megaera venefica]
MKKQISLDIVNQLNKGEKEATNLMEFLAVDLTLLLANTIPEFNFPKLPKPLGITKKFKLVAISLHTQFGFKIFDTLSIHKSDSIRALACYILGEQKLSFPEKLNLIKPLADDPNSGVREWAWMVLRADFTQELTKSIKLLSRWTEESSDNIRRFASELSRPRGVWCSHIKELRKEPWLGLDIIEPLRSDKAKYVQLSVGNWLNDAGKDHPDWVKDLCRDWSNQSTTPYTEKICKRAMRNLV